MTMFYWYWRCPKLPRNDHFFSHWMRVPKDWPFLCWWWSIDWWIHWSRNLKDWWSPALVWWRNLQMVTLPGKPILDGYQDGKANVKCLKKWKDRSFCHAGWVEIGLGNWETAKRAVTTGISSSGGVHFLGDLQSFRTKSSGDAQKDVIRSFPPVN